MKPISDEVRREVEEGFVIHDCGRVPEHLLVVRDPEQWALMGMGAEAGDALRGWPVVYCPFCAEKLPDPS